MPTTIDLTIGRQVDKAGVPFHRIRPAYRSFVKELFGLAVGLVFWLFPTMVTYFIALLTSMVAKSEDARALEDFSGMEINEILSYLSEGLYYIGLILIAWSILAIAYGRLSNRFFVNTETIAVEQGIIARTRNEISISHVRTVDVKQGLIDRIINVGEIEFSTAGTSGVDVSWQGIPGPAQAQNVIKVAIDSSETASQD